MTKEEAIKRLMDESCKSRLYCELYPDACMKEECEIYMAIKALNERPKGEWDYSDDMYETRVCSVCGFNTEDYVEYNYCPNCGARMKGADDED